jgi:hypothetical protein
MNEKNTKFATPKNQAEIAQLVEHQLPKLRVASSSLVFRSKRDFKEIPKVFCSFVETYFSNPVIQYSDS